MERKFDSELGKRVAEGSRKTSSKKAAILAATLSVCAIMVSGAAFMAPAIAGEELGKPVYWENVIEAQNDYLVYEDGVLVHYAEDQWTESVSFDVKRTTTLKAAVFNSPSEWSNAEYNKFVYSVNVNLRNLTYFGPDGAIVGVLAIPYSGALEPAVSWSMTDDDIMVNSSDDLLPEYVPAEVATDDAFINVTVALPDGYEYEEGSQISIQVMIKVPIYTPLPWDEDIVEEAFPDFDDLMVLPEESL
ncbi:TPA: hypothetical protein HA259_05085 [Thermoplasmata archaeon]|nr:hypothetical protein [Thermoplasmata archaeon]